MQTVPLQATPNQTMAVLLGNQNCRINVYQTSYGLFFDLYSNGSRIVVGVKCQNANRIVRYAYLGFVGDFAFYDTQGSSDPSYQGLGGRFQLVYIEQSDIDQAA